MNEPEWDVLQEDDLECPTCGGEAYCALTIPYEQHGRAQLYEAYLCPDCSRNDPEAQSLLLVFAHYDGQVNEAITDLVAEHARAWEKAVSRQLAQKSHL